jgi:hypothetical protein
MVILLTVKNVQGTLEPHVQGFPYQKDKTQMVANQYCEIFVFFERESTLTLGIEGMRRRCETE